MDMFTHLDRVRNDKTFQLYTVYCIFFLYIHMDNTKNINEQEVKTVFFILKFYSDV